MITDNDKPWHRSIERRRNLAKGFCQQVLATTEPFREVDASQARVMDIGCGYGFTTQELAERCREVVGLEPDEARAAEAARLGRSLANLQIMQGTLDSAPVVGRFDLIVLDNVFEHVREQKTLLTQVSDRLNPGGVAFLLMPNKLWPIEAHYRLPFLSYLPLPLANAYLRVTGKGSDYSSASYAPTYWKLNALLAERKEVSFRYVLPANIDWTMGASKLYRFGAAMIRRVPALWAVSKSFLVVGKKDHVIL